MLKSGHRKITLFLIFLTGVHVIAIILILKAQKVVLLNEDLVTRYPDGFETKVIRVDSQLVAFSSDSSCIKSPIVYLFGKRKAKSIFEITTEGTSCVSNSKFESMDVDGDGASEVVSEWVGSNEGAGGVRGLIIWDLDKRQSLVPLTGYPEEVKSEDERNLKIIATDSKTGKTFNFPTISDDFYTDYRSSDSGLKLDFASFIWDFDAGESRNSPHIWGLQRFELVENEFVKDASWHNGEKYTSEEKRPAKNIEAKLKELFNSLEKI